jgi:hypothetical protein
VKKLNGGDHASILAYTSEILDRQLTGDSLICQLFLHFVRASNYLVMRNVLPTGRGIIWHKLYDLKGNRDDKLLEDDGDDVVEVHKRCFHFHTCWYGCDVIPCLTTAPRKRLRYLLYYEGKQRTHSPRSSSRRTRRRRGSRA